jgi:outer membrane biogenesis lipoprotein LolB
LFWILTSCGTEPEVNQTSAVESNQTQSDNSISDYGTSGRFTEHSGRE